MKSLLVAALLLIVPAAAGAAGPEDDRAVMTTLEAMAEATIGKDVATLARVYGDDLFRSAASGRMLDNHLNILWVLVRRPQGPHGWQIVARQTTRIAPSADTPVKQ